MTLKSNFHGCIKRYKRQFLHWQKSQLTKRLLEAFSSVTFGPAYPFSSMISSFYISFVSPFYISLVLSSPPFPYPPPLPCVRLFCLLTPCLFLSVSLRLVLFFPSSSSFSSLSSLSDSWWSKNKAGAPPAPPANYPFCQHSKPAGQWTRRAGLPALDQSEASAKPLDQSESSVLAAGASRSGSLIAGWMITKGNNYSNANDENLQEIRANKIWLFFSLQKLVCSTIADTFFAFMGTTFAFSDTYLQK